MKRKTSLVHAICKNCGTQLNGRYCHHCGQDVFAGAQRTVKDLFFNALENMFVLDNKIFTTLKYLLFYPGKLSLEYKNSRIVRYVHPSKLFWFITIIFFAIFSINLKNNNILTVNLTSDNTKEIQQKPTERSKSDAGFSTSKAADATTVITPEQKQEIDSDELKDSENDKIYESWDQKFKEYLFSYGPYISFILIPFFAFLLARLFYKKEYFYVDHLGFVLHFHSFVFLLFGLYIGTTHFFPSFNYPHAVFLTIPAIYLIIALYVFYRPKKRSLIWKFILLSFIYFLTITIIIILGALWFVYYILGEKDIFN